MHTHHTTHVHLSVSVLCVYREYTKQIGGCSFTCSLARSLTRSFVCSSRWFVDSFVLRKIAKNQPRLSSATCMFIMETQSQAADIPTAINSNSNNGNGNSRSSSNSNNHRTLVVHNRHIASNTTNCSQMLSSHQ